MTDQKSRQWQTLYQKAVFEHDLEELPANIARAEAAIHSRLKGLSKRATNEDERQAINEALSVLRLLKKQHFPGWTDVDVSEREIGRAKSSGEA